MKVEIRLTRESGDNQKEAIECFERLDKSFFPFLIIRKIETEPSPIPPQAGWTGTLKEFVEFVELRESFGKDPNKDEMFKAFGFDIEKARNELLAEEKKRHERAL